MTTLPAMEVVSRASRLRERLADAGCEALLVTTLANIRYLTGFGGSAALLLVLPDGLVFLTDGRYGGQAGEQLAAAGVEARIEVGNAKDQQAGAVRAATGVARLGLEAGNVTWARQRAMAAEWFPDAELVPTEGLVEGLRQVKDAGEVARIEQACAVAAEALDAVRGMLAQRPRERDVAVELDSEMRRRGASGPSFETIVASGPNGAKPHARPGDRVIEEGDLVVVDFGATVDGYCSDTTRTFVVGEWPSETARRMYEVVAQSQALGVEALRAGVECAAVDRACRQVIAEAGWGEAFLHSTGHGVGLDIHEAPWVASTAGGSLVAGNVVTVEPGVYLPEHGGVRIEDTVVVTSDGRRSLTISSKDPIV
ncbi:MAG TPA: aminopeptidase P family protein [Acidimicrobiales bacterium]|nr:aminopeptidase P family protein [Acidimicrobiales bacterium]